MDKIEGKISNSIKQARKNAKLSQTELANPIRETHTAKVFERIMLML